MGRTIICSEGAVISGESDDELIAAMEVHLRFAHPELSGQLSREDILELAGDRPLQGGEP